MHKCANANCSHFIDIEVQAYVKVERNGVHYLCTSGCYKEWSDTNDRLVLVTNPFRDKPPRMAR